MCPEGEGGGGMEREGDGTLAKGSPGPWVPGTTARELLRITWKFYYRLTVAPHNPRRTRGNRTDVTYQSSFRRDASPRRMRRMHLDRAARDVLLFGLRLTDLDAYRYRRISCGLCANPFRVMIARYIHSKRQSSTETSQREVGTRFPFS